jgi:hypothetical protein
VLREQLDQLLSAEGWDPREPIDLSKLTDEQRTRALEVASMYRRVFMENPEGRTILGILVRQTLMHPTVNPNEDPRADGIREGRADLVRGIMFQCELATTGGEPQPITQPSPPAPRPTGRPARRRGGRTSRKF